LANANSFKAPNAAKADHRDKAQAKAQETRRRTKCFFPEFWAPLSQFQFSITENHGIQRIVPGMEKFLLLYFSASPFALSRAQREVFFAL